MWRRVAVALAAVALFTSAATLTQQSAAAEAVTDWAAPQQLDELLDFYPGSQKVDATSVEIDHGVVVSLPADVGIQATCDYYYLCLFSGNNHSGYKISFYVCAWRNLGNYSYPGGGYWNDKMSSLINNQTSGTRTPFYNYISNGNWDHRFTSVAFDSRTSLGSHNNLIDGVQVC